MPELEEKKQFTALFSLTPAFRFVVQVQGISVGAFTECTLPAIEWEMEQIKEGGLNTSVHQLPGQRKAATLTLKNGIAFNELLKWCVAAMNEDFKRKNLTITMYDVQLQPMLTWNIEGALPVRWRAPELKTDSNTVAIQTLELVCGLITVEKGSG